MSWILILIALAAGFFILMPFMAYLSSRRILGHRVDLETGTTSHQLYYFYSDNCGPCRSMTPIIDELSSEHDNVVKVDIRQDPETARKFGIRATPTTILVRDNVVQKVLLGAKSKKQLLQLLENQT